MQSSEGKPAELPVGVWKKLTQRTDFPIQVVVASILVSVIMAASNTYLALFAAMTISASIPSATIAKLIFGRKATIHQLNYMQAAGASGEGLAAGLSFTLPALLLTGVWQTFNFWESLLVGACGGTLGVLLMVPLRRALICESPELKYPEGLATAELLKAFMKEGAISKEIMWGGVAGGLVKFLTSGVGFLQSTIESAFRVGRTVFYAGTDLSMALLGVGYIVRFNASTVMLLGGIFAWVVMIPILSFLEPLPSDMKPLDYAYNIWKTQVRYLGIGVMIVGCIITVIRLLPKVATAWKYLKQGFSRKVADEELPMTEQDMRGKALLFLGLFCTAAILSLYVWQTGSVVIGVIACVVMLVAAFFIDAMSSYLCGMVGSSNNPVSGMIIITLLLAGGTLWLVGLRGPKGIICALIIAGVVCCSASLAGALSQDLKTAQIVGSRPRSMQWVQIWSIWPAAIVVPLVMFLLHKAYTIGVGLKAPQAALFGNIAQMWFTAGTPVPWTMIILGGALGVVVFIADKVLEKLHSSFRLFVMLIGIGIYLPVSLAVPIFLGGLIDLLTSKPGVKDEDRAGFAIRFAAGLIAGEALMGILIAIPIALQVEVNKIFTSAVLSIIALIAGYYLMRHYAKKEAAADE